MLRYEQAIGRRQAREKAVVALRRQIDDDRGVQMRIEFENKKLPPATVTVGNIAERRSKLVKLLAMERQCLLAELDAQRPFEEDRMIVLKRRAKVLAENKAAENRVEEFVNPFSTTPSLIDEKKQAIFENQIFEALLQREYAQLVERELADEEAKHLRNSQLRIALDEQTRIRRAELAQKKLDFQPDFSKTNIIERKQSVTARDKSVIFERESKISELSELATNETKMIADLVAQDEARMESERQGRERAKKQLQAFMANSELEKAKRALFEKELEQAQSLEAEKHWNKRSEEWQLRETRRQELTAQVYAERAVQISEKHDRIAKLKNTLS